MSPEIHCPSVTKMGKEPPRKPDHSRKEKEKHTNATTGGFASEPQSCPGVLCRDVEDTEVNFYRSLALYTRRHLNNPIYLSCGAYVYLPSL